MTLTNLCKTPFPWFGGKSDAAPVVWEALGDVPHYVEPFAGSLAVLMRRPHTSNRAYYSETVNDAAGVFLDPPYADTAERMGTIYTHDDLQVAHAAREWAIKAGTDPKIRIVFAGFDGEHGTAFVDAGWREVEWYKAGFLKGGMGNLGGTGNTQMTRDRLWFSPHCLRPASELAQTSLFGGL